MGKIGTFDQTALTLDSGKTQQWPGGIGDAHKPDDRPTCTQADFVQTISPTIQLNGHPNKTIAGCAADGTYEYQMNFKQECISTPYTPTRPCCKSSSVKVPNSVSACSYSASNTMVTIVSVLGAIVSFGGLIFVVLQRDTKTMKFAQGQFLIIFSFGCTLASIGPIFFISIPSSASCTLRVWWFNLSAVTVFAPLFVKLYRICALVFNKKMKKMKLSNRAMFGYLFAIIFVDVAILFVCKWNAR